MAGPNVKVTRNGQTLTQRVWDLLADVSREVGCPVEVAQGGFKAGIGAGASAGTHDGGDVVDVRVANVPDHLRIPLVVALRKRNGCAWLRAPQYGWTSTGPHIHCVFRDSFYPLSGGARQQVDSYDRGRNGLANDGPDPFPRPVQHHWTAPIIGPKPTPIPVGGGHADWPGFALTRVMHGAPVSELQRGLNRRGIAVQVTGMFDAVTAAAVTRYKRSHPWLWPTDGTGPSVGLRTYRSVVR